MGEVLEQRWSFYSIEDTIEALKVYSLNVPDTTLREKKKFFLGAKTCCWNWWYDQHLTDA